MILFPPLVDNRVVVAYNIVNNEHVDDSTVDIISIYCVLSVVVVVVVLNKDLNDAISASFAISVPIVNNIDVLFVVVVAAAASACCLVFVFVVAVLTIVHDYWRNKESMMMMMQMSY